MARFGLTLRLLALLAASILPAMAALIYVQIGLRHERTERVTDGALHQAQVLAAEVDTLVDGARQLMLALAHSRSGQSLEASCGDQLAALHGALASYALLELVGGDQRIACAVGTAPAPALRTEIAAAIAAGTFVIGHYEVSPGGLAMLPMILPYTTATGQHAAVVAAFDLAWLRGHVQRFRSSAVNSLTIADRDGTILVRLPDPTKWVGHQVVAGARDLVGAATAGTRTIRGLDGKERAVGYVPATLTGGLYIAYGVFVPDILAEIDRATSRGYLLIGVGAVLALLLMMLITRRLVHGPTEALLRAAQRWSAGDLATRASVRAPEGSEFNRLAGAFNDMAETLDRRRGELRQLNTTLEARVAERTRALSDTNNRLQVEINERERTDAALRKAQKLQAVGHLAGGTAHEFNNVLATIMGALELLRVRLGEGHPLQRYTGPAMQAAQRGAGLTSQLLAFARRRRLMPVPVDLNAVIAEMRELIESTIGRGITVDVVADQSLWPALADRHEIEAAVLNLVLNARDALAPGGTLRLTTRNVVAEPGGTDLVELVVVDDGVGMTDEELAHAIDPFFTTKAPGHGAGLGLSQVHGMAQQLGGDLRIVSRKGEGTTVCLLLPRAVAAQAQPAEPAGHASGARSLLLVDDDAQVRDVTADMLNELGYQVATACDGAQALERLRDGSYAVLVADYAMPGMSGIELIDAARRMCPGIMPMLITGYMDFEMAPGTEPLTARQILRKPFTLHELSDRISELSEAV